MVTKSVTTWRSRYNGVRAGVGVGVGIFPRRVREHVLDGSLWGVTSRGRARVTFPVGSLSVGVTRQRRGGRESKVMLSGIEVATRSSRHGRTPGGGGEGYQRGGRKICFGRGWVKGGGEGGKGGRVGRGGGWVGRGLIDAC